MTDANGEVITSNHWSPYPKDAIGLKVPELKVTSVQQMSQDQCDDTVYDSCWKIKLTSDAVALFTWVEALGMFSLFISGS